MPQSCISHKAMASVICMGLIFSSNAAAAVVPISSSLESNSRVSVPHDQPGDVDSASDSQGAIVLDLTAQSTSSMTTLDGSGTATATATATWNGAQAGSISYSRSAVRTTGPTLVGLGTGYEWSYTFQTDTLTSLTFTANRNYLPIGGDFNTWYTINGNRQFSSGPTTIDLQPGTHTIGFDDSTWTTNFFWDTVPVPPTVPDTLYINVEWELVPEPSTVTLLMLINLALVSQRCRV